MGKRNGQRLDRKKIADLPSREHGYDVADENVVGLYLRVKPSGLKSWVLRYRVAGVQHLITLGNWPGVGVVEARTRAEEKKGPIRDGLDPLAEKKARDDAPTMEKLAERFDRDHIAKKAAATATEYRRLVKVFILPLLGPKRKVTAVTTDDVANLLAAVSGTPFQSNRIRSVLQKMLSKAELWNMRPLGTNPARGHERENEPKRTRVLSDIELVALGAALRARDAVAREKHKRVRPSPVSALVRLLLLTGARVGEALSMKWTDLDLEAGVWTLTQHKTARTAGVRNVALPSHAVAVIRTITVVLGNPFVFVGTRRGKAMDDPRLPWEEIREAAGLENVHVHDLRRTFGSTGIGIGIPELRIATLLGHAAGSTTAIYARVVDPVQAQDVERIAGRLYGLLSGAPGAVSAAG